ncbi:hypothetical protein QT381_15395 [Galbitalea sp. SE-J8]|uniref:hypothetical protein n=1 Tax=Galbitalea sp. SE-J8 TaxID=3054952 RepID=UPI00259CB522|nr:hypothetical protein [Galbitalea sp. SE-J8]MDM4764384.1 hypothetical protein [Galbitalea sp. SE-J8]
MTNDVPSGADLRIHPIDEAGLTPANYFVLARGDDGTWNFTQTAADGWPLSELLVALEEIARDLLDSLVDEWR